MAQETLDILYILRVEGGETHEFPVRLDAQSLEQFTSPAGELPDWVALDFEQCEGCPLQQDRSPTCPAARSLATLLPGAEKFLSYVQVDAEVHVAGRVISATVPLQNALSSLVGLCLATSGCPNVAFLKPMARFHVPFATMEETIFRATSSYLLGQYFRKAHTGEDDFTLSGLEAAYARLHQVNMGLARRMRHVSTGDAKLNAIVRLDMFTHELPYVIGEQLTALTPYFKGFWLDEVGEEA